MRYQVSKKGSGLVLLAILTLLSAGPGAGQTDKSAGTAVMRPLSKTTIIEPPYLETCSHTYNNLSTGISNWGYFGSLGWTARDCETGLQAPSAEFPTGSGVGYLYIAAIWIGAIVDGDTLVSVGFDGWMLANELYPCSHENCGLERLSCRRADAYYNEAARADQEFIAVYTDTLVDRGYTPDDWSGRPYMPLNIEVTQHSYAWSVPHAEDFIIIEYNIRNIGTKSLNDIYVGIYVDGDVGHRSSGLRHSDDICGFVHGVPSPAGQGFEESINLGYIVDNDGDPAEGEFTVRSARSIAGLRFLNLPGDNQTFSFNWWRPNGNPALDWGPMMEITRRDFGTNGQGVPEGDCSKYFIMSNGEIDYDQIFSGVDFSAEGWIPPSPMSPILVTGGDVRFVSSAGSFDLLPGEAEIVTIAYVAGERFHKDPSAYERFMTIQGEIYPDSFYNTFSFEEIGRNAIMASRVYDNPGVDTDGNGDCGEFWLIPDTVDGVEVIDTFYYSGDGVPDYRAVSSLPAPRLRYESDHGSVTLRWNGMDCENTIDPITRFADFEGFRVYMGNQPSIPSLGLICGQDKVNFSVSYLTSDETEYRMMDEPMTLASIREKFGDDFDPLVYLCSDAPDDFESGGSSYCFTPIGWNQSVRGWDDGATEFDNSCIRKTYLDEIERGIVTSEFDSLNPDLWIVERDRLTGEDVMYHKFYEYEFTIDNLFPDQSWYFSVTALDYGDISTGMLPVESNPLDNLIQANPSGFPSTDASIGPQVIVYPNPYYGEDRYARSGYEDPNHTGLFDEERRIHFTDLPPRCKLKIYTISGDLVREFEHPGSSSKSDTELSWNLKSRDDVLVTSGIYLFVIESYWGNQIGKIVIIL